MKSRHHQFVTPGRAVEQRIETLLARLTLEEKIDLLGGVPEDQANAYGGDTHRNERAGIPSLKFANGPLGVREWRDHRSTAYPATVALAASWEPELAYRLGEAIGRDARAAGVHVLLAPGVNLYRSPLCGRSFEYLGEDPYLASRLVAPYIQGCQDQGVSATVKHLALNFQEYNRHHISSDVDERTLHEMYLPAFRAAVREGGVGAVMTAYNLVNSVHCAEHATLISAILKGRWGFDGLVMSDWTSTYSTVNTALAGLDLEMPCAKWLDRQHLLPAVRDGQVPEAVIDDKIRRLLRLMVCFGWLDREQKDPAIPLEDPASAAVAREVATQGTVLLRNEGLLPLDAALIRKIAVIGPNAHPTPVSAGGSARIRYPWRSTGVSEGLQALLGPERVGYAIGVDTERHLKTYDRSVYFTPDGQPGLLAEYFDNTQLRGEPKARLIETHLNQHWGWSEIGGGAVPRENFSIRWTGAIRPEKSGRHIFYLHIWDAKYRVQIGDRTLLADESGNSSGLKTACLDLEAGVSYPVTVEYRWVRFFNNTIRFGWEHHDGVLAERDRAAQLAREADAAVVCVGFNPNLEGEGIARSFALPDGQDELILTVAEANPNTIVVVNAGGNVEMTRWIDRVEGVLMAWYPGQEGGHAIADILFGRVNPSGKLPVTFEARLEDRSSFACYHDENNDQRVPVADGIFAGYRHHDRTGVSPLFPFGHGLGYTTFAYENLRLSSKTLPRGGTLTISFDLVNTGEPAAAETAQLYLGDEEASVPRPAKELKGFVKVFLKPGERRRVKFPLDETALRFFDMRLHDWKAEPGRFIVHIAASAADIRLTGSFRYTG